MGLRPAPLLLKIISGHDRELLVHLTDHNTGRFQFAACNFFLGCRSSDKSEFHGSTLYDLQVQIGEEKGVARECYGFQEVAVPTVAKVATLTRGASFRLDDGVKTFRISKVGDVVLLIPESSRYFVVEWADGKRASKCPGDVFTIMESMATCPECGGKGVIELFTSSRPCGVCKGKPSGTK